MFNHNVTIILARIGNVTREVIDIKYDNGFTLGVFIQAANSVTSYDQLTGLFEM